MIDDDEVKELTRIARIEGIEKFVVGAFIMKEGRLLIVRRASTEGFLPNLQEIPSGGVEVGETLLAALRREVWEETALRILDIKTYVNCFDYVSGSGKNTRESHYPTPRGTLTN
jgi:8-oxo-dGTP diphosphatase